jgi:hypothetical protein
MVGIKVRLTQMSGGIRLNILSSVPSFCQVLGIRSGVHASNVRMQSFLTRLQLPNTSIKMVLRWIIKCGSFMVSNTMQL